MRGDEAGKVRGMLARRGDGQRDQQLDQAIHGHLNRVLTPLLHELELLTEKTLALNGERVPGRAAITRDQLLPLLELRTEPTATAAAAAPTQAEFNALLADVQLLYRLLARVLARLELPRG